jgi:hypothetical protein
MMTPSIFRTAQADDPERAGVLLDIGGAAASVGGPDVTGAAALMAIADAGSNFSLTPGAAPADAGSCPGGICGATVNVYGETGSLLSAHVERQSGFTVTAPELGNGEAFSITESVDGHESVPLVVLDAGTLANAVTAARAQFAASGDIEVRHGEFVCLYTAGQVPVLHDPALVYDPQAHTVALDILGNVPVPMIVLGASTLPATLDVSGILVRQ